MMSLFWSSLLWLSLLHQLAELSSIYDAGAYSKTLCSLHITHDNHNNSVYCNFNILYCK